uniref:Uncharacterized protein n=1 Tax=Cannabis sativa TaxID=3483 RepID=A0A803R3N2_CANSA
MLLYKVSFSFFLRCYGCRSLFPLCFSALLMFSFVFESVSDGFSLFCSLDLDYNYYNNFGPFILILFSSSG